MSKITTPEERLLSPREKDDLKTPPQVNWENCPLKFMGGLQRYYEGGILPGSFLSAVLSNDLSRAIFQADADSLRDLHRLVSFLDREFPSIAWGNRTHFMGWASVRQQQFRDSQTIKESSKHAST